MSGKEMQAFYSTYSRIADLAQAIRPLKLTRGSGERCKLPQRGPGGISAEIEFGAL